MPIKEKQIENNNIKKKVFEFSNISEIAFNNEDYNNNLEEIVINIGKSSSSNINFNQANNNSLLHFNTNNNYDKKINRFFPNIEKLQVNFFKLCSIDVSIINDNPLISIQDINTIELNFKFPINGNTNDFNTILFNLINLKNIETCYINNLTYEVNANKFFKLNNFIYVDGIKKYLYLNKINANASVNFLTVNNNIDNKIYMPKIYIRKISSNFNYNTNNTAGVKYLFNNIKNAYICFHPKNDNTEIEKFGNTFNSVKCLGIFKPEDIDFSDTLDYKSFIISGQRSI